MTRNPRLALIVIVCLALSGCHKKVPLARFVEDHEALRIVAPYLPANPVILEGGSYHGEDAVEMARQWPGGVVHTIEAVPALYQVTLKNTAAYKNIHAYEVALSDTTGRATFHISADDSPVDAPGDSGSLLAPKFHLDVFPRVRFADTITVATTTIDDWAEANGVDRVDFMWLDIQGVELPVMKGSPRILKTVRAIMTEVEFLELYEGQALLPGVQTWLEEQGFQIIATDYDPEGPKNSKSAPGNPWFGNAVFVRL